MIAVGFSNRGPSKASPLSKSSSIPSVPVSDRFDFGCQHSAASSTYALCSLFHVQHTSSRAILVVPAFLRFQLVT